MALTFSEIINSDTPTLVDFSAEWCGPCKMMPLILKELKSNIGDQAKIIKVDIDANRATAEQFQIRSVPTLIIFKNGEVKWRQSGVVLANELEKVVRENL